jgi:hypothetical protein
MKLLCLPRVDERWLPTIKTLKPPFLYGIAIAAFLSLVLWFSALLVVYLADDWFSPSADERSIPAVRTY